MNGNDRSGRKTLPLVILVVLSAVAGGYGYLTPEQTHDTGRYYFNNAGGAVMFEHRAHSNRVEVCADCHHDVLLVDLENQCRACHDDDFDAGDFDHADLVAVEEHECAHCHKVDESMPMRSCRDCHPSIQENEPGVVTCTECHDAEYSAGLMSHDDMRAIEGHSCETCHVVRSVSDVYHERCNRCHEEVNSPMFVDADGNTRCNVCHLK